MLEPHQEKQHFRDTNPFFRGAINFKVRAMRSYSPETRAESNGSPWRPCSRLLLVLLVSLAFFARMCTRSQLMLPFKAIKGSCYCSRVLALTLDCRPSRKGRGRYRAQHTRHTRRTHSLQMLAFKRQAAKRWPPEKLSELGNHNQIWRIKMETKLRQLVKFMAPRFVWVRTYTVCVCVCYTV